MGEAACAGCSQDTRKEDRPVHRRQIELVERTRIDLAPAAAIAPPAERTHDAAVTE